MIIRAPRVPQKLPLRAVPTLFLFSARSAEKIFFGDSNTRAFCAEGAEKIFYMIATQEPFGAEGAKRFVSKNSKPKRLSESANSLCEIAFFFTKHSIFRLRAKFLKNGG